MKMINTEKTKVLIGDESSEAGLKWAMALKNEGMFAITRKSSGTVLLNATLSENPDILILNAAMPEFDAAELLRRVRNKCGRLPITIVVSCCESPQLEKEITDAGACYFMIKPFDSEQLVRKVRMIEDYSLGRISPVPSHDMMNIEYVVTEIIQRLGVPANLKGYRYLRRAVILTLMDAELLDSITKGLYPTIASEFETTSSRVERAIRHAIEYAWEKGAGRTDSFFSSRYGENKPTNSELIAFISDKLRIQYFPGI